MARRSRGSWCTYSVTNLESLLPELGAAYCCNDKSISKAVVVEDALGAK